MIYVFESGSIVYDESVLTEADKARAVAVEKLPEQETIPGKIAVIKADKATNKVWWEYVDSPAAVEFRELETQIQGLQQAMAELTILLAGGEA
jgi:hypothetical protein